MIIANNIGGIRIGIFQRLEKPLVAVCVILRLSKQSKICTKKCQRLSQSQICTQMGEMFPKAFYF